MDEAFFLRARRLLGDRPRARLDHDTFIAQVAARQGGTPTARFGARTPVHAVVQGETASVTVLLLAEEGWRRAIEVQRGCFNRAGVRRRINTA